MRECNEKNEEKLDESESNQKNKCEKEITRMTVEREHAKEFHYKGRTSKRLKATKFSFIFLPFWTDICKLMLN